MEPMKSPLKNEQGAILIIELVALAAVLAAAGFAAYQYASRKNAANQPTKPKPHVVAKASPSPSVTKPTNEFDVPELGFKMTLPSGLDGLSYMVETLPNADKSPSNVKGASFNTQYLQQVGCSGGLG